MWGGYVGGASAILGERNCKTGATRPGAARCVGATARMLRWVDG